MEVLTYLDVVKRDDYREMLYWRAVRLPNEFGRAEYRSLISDYFNAGHNGYEIDGDPQFADILADAADRVHLPSQEWISEKTQRRLFPRPGRNGKMTSFQWVVMKNCLGAGANTFDTHSCDHLLLIQPPFMENDYHFQFGVMPYSAIETTPSGDQIKMRPQLDQFSYLSPLVACDPEVVERERARQGVWFKKKHQVSLSFYTVPSEVLRQAARREFDRLDRSMSMEEIVTGDGGMERSDRYDLASAVTELLA